MFYEPNNSMVLVHQISFLLNIVETKPQVEVVERVNPRLYLQRANGQAAQGSRLGKPQYCGGRGQPRIYQ